MAVPADTWAAFTNHQPFFSSTIFLRSNALSRSRQFRQTSPSPSLSPSLSLSLSLRAPRPKPCQSGDTILAMISEARRSTRSRTVFLNLLFSPLHLPFVLIQPTTNPTDNCTRVRTHVRISVHMHTYVCFSFILSLDRFSFYVETHCLPTNRQWKFGWFTDYLFHRDADATRRDATRHDTTRPLKVEKRKHDRRDSLSKIPRDRKNCVAFDVSPRKSCPWFYLLTVNALRCSSM